MKKFFYFKSVILLSIFVTLFLLLHNIFYPRISVQNLSVEIGSDYVPKVYAYNLLTDLSDKVTIDDEVDVNKVREYTLNAHLKYVFFSVNKTFTVSVIDNISPIIELKGDNPSFVCPNRDYVEEGYIASDNYDGDITDMVTLNKDNDKILYEVKDSSGNTNKIERKIVYEDNDKPIIILNGSDYITLYLGDSYIEPGYTANDNCEGDITNKVTIEGIVDTSKVGSYVLKYSVSDSSGNETTVQRSVYIKKKVSYHGNGSIYLTFDDGPSHLTSTILDILDEENVKATFFVVRADQTTRRAHNSGHTIALHSYTHNYSYIYSSSNNYFNDLNNVSNAVYNVIGIRPSIIRFPGGSSNTISRNYNKGIMSYLTTEVVNRGYTYFDWNVDSNDAGSDIYNSNNIYYNVINNLSHNKTNIILMHDSSGHDATVKALRNIISYGKNNNYSFKAITEETPVVIHDVNN